ncbi:siderophore iron transporter [Colletotrichum fioriniae PJ7]|uniref:Siderophore iron transporter n=1 Tax=Colletotrichum fioriniae PJ7 TaxID=1445577 RepID=A0A010RB38_9PEZI|nr:siderophore iron transporter [Colletotrichum fioriniae PJ7]
MARYQAHQWREPTIIAMIVLGGIVVIAFSLTVSVAFLLGGNMWISFYLCCFCKSLTTSAFLESATSITSSLAHEAFLLGSLCVSPIVKSGSACISLVIMCEILIALAGGTIVMVEPIAIMDFVPRRHAAIGLVILSMATIVDGAIGSSISGAIWTNLMPSKLENYLTDELKSETLHIYGDLTKQMSYDGEPPRDMLSYLPTAKRRRS